MQSPSIKTFTAFLGQELIACAPLSELAVILRKRKKTTSDAMPLVFDDASGDQVELDLRGTIAEVSARYVDASASASEAANEAPSSSPGRGRPRLGVIAREVTLLPEHWDWLASRPGGASVALRKLVHEARQANAAADQRRRTQERSYKVMLALAGNLPNFEEASRALFAGEPQRLAKLGKAWPSDIRDYILRLATA